MLVAKLAGPACVSKACRIMGFRRDTFYEVRRAFQVGDVAGLVANRRGPQEPHQSRVSEEVEEKILAYSLEHPTHGQQRVATELRLLGLHVSPTGCGAWGIYEILLRVGAWHVYRLSDPLRVPRDRSRIALGQM